MISLDIRTTYAANAVLYVTLAAMLTYVWAERKTYPGFGHWTLSAWSGLVGTLLVALRAVLPDAITILVANGCLLLAVILLVTGLEAFLGGRSRLLLHALIMAGYLLALAVFTYLHPNLRLRILVISLTMSALAGYGVVRIRQRMATVLEEAHPLFLWVLVLFLAANVGRAALVILLPPRSNDFMVPSTTQGLLALSYLLCEAMLNLGFLVLNSQRVERDLRLAMEECKVIRGLIPICARCKKIRDGQGHWGRLESYLERHTEAKLSHGLCPECAAAFRAEAEAAAVPRPVRPDPGP